MMMNMMMNKIKIFIWWCRNHPEIVWRKFKSKFKI